MTPATAPAAMIAAQAAYHRQLFGACHRWNEVWRSALDFLGDAEAVRRLALDQTGHFGPRGVALVADRLLAAADGPLSRVVELGSGFGGALRHAGSELRARGADPFLFGVDLVPDHCRIAVEIGHGTDGARTDVLAAEAGLLPFAPGSIDAAFAVGSASHFPMEDVLAECGRVLRPGGVLVMTEETSLRPAGAPEPGEAFLRHHPRGIYGAATPEERRAQIDRGGLRLVSFESLAPWATPLLRQRAQMLRFMEHCARQVFGAEGCELMIGTLASAADEYERGAIQPALIVARRARP